jgi:hypothetical protein
MHLSMIIHPLDGGLFRSSIVSSKIKKMARLKP